MVNAGGSEDKFSLRMIFNKSLRGKQDRAPRQTGAEGLVFKRSHIYRNP
jgi:hypothetical protein